MQGKDFFLLGLFRRRLEHPALKRAVREQQSLFDATTPERNRKFADSPLEEGGFELVVPL